MNDKIDNIKDSVDKLQIDDNNAKFKHLEQKITQQENKMDSISNKLDILTDKIGKDEYRSRPITELMTNVPRSKEKTDDKEDLSPQLLGFEEKVRKIDIKLDDMAAKNNNEQK